MTRGFAVLALLLAGGVVAAPVPKALKAKTPTVDGKWLLVGQNWDGKEYPTFNKWMWEIEGERLTYHRPDRDGVYRPSGAEPAATITPSSAGKAGDYDRGMPNGKINPMLIVIERDEMTVCHASEAAQTPVRPVEPKPAAQVNVLRFKRVEEK